MPDKSPDIASMREVYSRQALRESEAGDDPIAFFHKWFREALTVNVHEANACTLATASADGKPSARIVLLKGADEEGFVIYTNANSRKGREMLANPNAALVFWWPELERQVRIEGKVERVDDALSDAYFASRPRESRLGAWASDQSSVVADSDELERRFNEAKKQFGDAAIPRPDHWGGFRIIPESIEFWQGRPGRLHDRLVFIRKNTTWDRNRLSP